MLVENNFDAGVLFLTYFTGRKPHFSEYFSVGVDKHTPKSVRGYLLYYYKKMGNRSVTAKTPCPNLARIQTALKSYLGISDPVIAPDSAVSMEESQPVVSSAPSSSARPASDAAPRPKRVRLDIPIGIPDCTPTPAGDHEASFKATPFDKYVW